MSKISSLSLVLCLCLMKAQTYDWSNSPSGGIQKLQTIFSWKALDFAYSTPSERQQAINNGSFNAGALVPVDVDVIRGINGERVLITIPRLQNGVPVTLGLVTNKKSADGNPIIQPYPDWQWNTLGDCNHLTSVWRVHVDDCNRIWVLDTGKVVSQQICPPQLLVFDPTTDQLVSRYKFPPSQVRQLTLYINPVIDILNNQGTCPDTFVYITDPTGFQLVVYDHRQQRSWSIRNNLLFPYPSNGTFTINGLSFDMMDGLFSMALSPLQANGDKTLFFHSLASVTESYVPVSVVRNFTNFANNSGAMARAFRSFPNPRSGQSAAQAMDKNGVLFYGMIPENSLGCWNSLDYPEYGGNNLERLVTSSELFPFTSGMKILKNKSGSDEIWMMTMPYAKYMNGVLSPNETNFRILAGYTSELVHGTKCDVTASQNTYEGPKPCTK